MGRGVHLGEAAARAIGARARRLLAQQYARRESEL
jgi:hypothetical protein